MQAVLTSGRHHRYVSAETIYGLILFLAVLAADDGSKTDLQLLVEGIGAAIVVWFAHVVALTIARQGRQREGVVSFRASLGDAVAHSAGILIGPTPALIVLTLGACDILDGDLAYWLALAVGIAGLGLLGLVAFAEQHARWYVCVGGAVLAALAGFVAITLKAIFG